MKLGCSLCILALGLTSAGVMASERAAVLVTSPEAGESARALQVLAQEALEAGGLRVVDPPSLVGFHPLDPTVSAVLDEARVERVFSVELLPIGGNLLVTLVERDREGLGLVAQARLTLTSIEEADVAVPRLVRAVLARQPASEEARVDDVMVREGRDLPKRSGEFFWGLGLVTGVGLEKAGALGYGANIMVAFEASAFRVDLELVGLGSEDMGLFDLAIEANYLILDGDISPFVGGGVSWLYYYINTASGGADDMGAAFTASAGVEFLRLYDTRLIIEARVLLPTFALELFGATTRYVPVATLNVAFIF